MTIIITILLLLMYTAFPLVIQAVIFIINLFIKDSIPILDEAIMVLSMYKRLNTLVNVLDKVEMAVLFIKKYKWVILVGIGVLILVVVG